MFKFCLTIGNLKEKKIGTYKKLITIFQRAAEHSFLREKNNKLDKSQEEGFNVENKHSVFEINA